jgi:hypothetical protein
MSPTNTNYLRRPILIVSKARLQIVVPLYELPLDTDNKDNLDHFVAKATLVTQPRLMLG